jgi:hypothetical protein
LLQGGRRAGECASSVHSPIRRGARMARCCALGFLLGVSSGCYVYPPVVNTPSPGAELRLDLNDRGRAALGDLIGQSAVNVEGVLRSSPDTAYVLGVTSVTYQRGQTNRWSGEPLTVSKNFVVNTTQRTFSKSRTWMTAAGMVAGVAALIATRDLFGLGSEPGDPGGGPGGGGGGGSFIRGN